MERFSPLKRWDQAIVWVKVEILGGGFCIYSIYPIHLW
jgi:hypothetical protein